jgi:hypothetical protein
MSPLITCPVPRNPPALSIILPIDSSAKSGTPFLIPYYLTVKGEVRKVVTPIYNTIPVKGFVTTGARAVKYLSDDVSTKTMLQTFTATTYSGARILARLTMEHPDLATSQAAVTTTIASEF